MGDEHPVAREERGELARQHAAELAAGERFAFGENWRRFLERIDEQRIGQAERSLQEMLEAPSLAGRSLLDVGCGSGLFSLAARRLGARVRSFDYDQQCVACAAELKRRWLGEDDAWGIEHGSLLDEGFLDSLGTFDVVYCWGMLHQTGAMYRAMDNVHRLVRPGGQLFISIYNDQGGASRRWRRLKRLYNRSPRPLQLLIVLAVGGYFEARAAAARLARLENPLPMRDWRKLTSPRGMSVWHDLVDWVGGYPFEVARPDDVVDFYRRRGFSLERLKTVGAGHGCNEYVFVRGPA